jgi:hypothetical protein
VTHEVGSNKKGEVWTVQRCSGVSGCCHLVAGQLCTALTTKHKVGSNQRGEMQTGQRGSGVSGALWIA